MSNLFCRVRACRSVSESILHPTHFPEVAEHLVGLGTDLLHCPRGVAFVFVRGLPNVDEPADVGCLEVLVVFEVTGTDLL